MNLKLPNDESLEELLIECASLINSYGPDSGPVQDFIQAHSENAEFVELADIAVKLKRMLEVREPSAVQS
jgi:hypothetical protein